ncbi:YozQ family protein [Priestia abyssalis]|uniref:YozQ family protein n=1 Tax=Priestia abyssalis TaxID=1221450 RepID=UPI000995030E|nr:YozQ family protein [Priestia abyssalis]
MRKDKENMAIANQGADAEQYSNQDTPTGNIDVTQEQVSDVYMAGTSDGVMQLEGNKELHIPQTGYEE